MRTSGALMTRKIVSLIITSIPVAKKAGHSVPDPTPLKPSGVYDHHRTEDGNASSPIEEGPESPLGGGRIPS